MHPTELPDETLLAACDVRHVKRGGPGGQHRNKTQSGVILRHRPSGIIAEANERRDQARNLSAALFRLRLELAISLRVVREHRSDLWQQRCRGGRVQVAAEHVDYPALLAEALDELAVADWDLRSAGERLGCSMSQLLKLLALEHRALLVVNGQRRQRGLPAVRP